MTMAGARLYQCYLDNYFKFPKEIKNDIIYCQRALKAHIKVHQLVVEKFKQEEGKIRILEELEAEIYEINAEQHYLLLRLRRVIDEFYKSMQLRGTNIDAMTTNQFISREVVPHVEDENVQILPVSVLFRNTEEKLLEKYFGNEKEFSEKPEDSNKTNEQKYNSMFHSGLQQQQQQPQLQSKSESLNANSCNIPNGQLASSRNGNANHLSQVSLLKPISQRMVSGTAGTKFGVRALYAETTNNMHVNIATYSRATPHEAPQRNLAVIASDEIKQQPDIELPVSKNVTLSRLNLRQALKKAKTETLAAAKATANILTKPAAPITAPPIASAPSAMRPAAAPPPPPAAAPTLPASSSVAIAVNKNKTDTKLKPGKSTTNANAKNAATEFSSSSEESTGERGLTPPHVLWPREFEEKKTHPEDYGQEMFLRLFGLFTPEMHVQMQQRRSKRRRRTVHNNERADFHYGRFENVIAPTEDKKRRRAFLLSPQIKRGLQTRKPTKRTAADKNSESGASRSSSSSPDDKRACNECLKGGGSIDKCEECKGFYHQTCHSDDANMDVKPFSAAQVRRTLSVDHVKLCPACSRAQLNLIKKETKQYQALKSTVQELEKKMAKEKNRRASLQHKSKMHKIQMRNLFNIVRTIKSDNENDSSD